MIPSRFLLAAGFLLALPVLAQAPPSTGTVTGHVVCGDTQRPARFATVTLFGVPANAGAEPKFDKEDMKSLGAAMAAVLGQSNMAQAQTAMDGSFTATGLVPGDYYVFAAQSGYVTPKNAIQAAMDAGADIKKPLPGVPIVHVVGDRSANVDVAMQRGAALYGTVRWDDGSPVSNARVAVVSPKGKEKDFPPSFAMLAGAGGGLNGMLAITDDLGRFRLTSLAPGEYYVQASMTTSSGFAMKNGAFDLKSVKQNTPLAVFAPSAFHQADAKTITVHTGEDRGDVDITFNLNSTHSVSGRIASAEDRHGLNSAEVKLTDTADKTFSRASSVDEQGNYTVTFLPPGTYDMTVTEAGDTEPVKKKTGMFASDHTLRSYQDGKSSVIVADSNITGKDMELLPSKKTKEDVDLNKILGGLAGGPAK